MLFQRDKKTSPVAARLAQTAYRDGSSALGPKLPTMRTGEVTPRAVVIGFYRHLDDAMGVLHLGTACQSGCDYCCYYHTVASPMEVFAIREHVMGLDGPERERVFDQLAQNLETIQPLTPDQHNETNVPCPFLVSRHCSIYDLRPVACRRHHCVDVTPCKAAFHDPRTSDR